MRAAVQRYDASLVDHLHENHHIPAGLQDLVITIGTSTKVRHPPRSGWLDELGRLKDGRSLGLGVARCAPYWVVQNCPAAPSAVSCSRMYVRTCSSSNPTVDTA